MINATKARRIESLDAMRGIAALCVVVYHYTTNYSRLDLGYELDSFFSFPRGNLGVHFFFILSGFVIFMTLDKVKSAKEFLIRRFIRLYPTYWLCIIITAFFSLFQQIPALKMTLWDVIGNFTMLQALIRPIISIKYVDGSYWSLMPELLFYIFMAVLLRFRLLNNIKVISVILLVLSIVGIQFDLSIFMLEVILNFHWYSLFFAGIMFYIMYKNDEEKKKWYNYIILLFCLATTFYMMNSLGKDIVDCAIVLGVHLLFLLFVFGKMIKFPRIFLFLGKISYPWYLLHQNIGYLILYKMDEWFGWNSPVFIIIPMFITGFMAYIVTEYFEKSIMPLLKTKLLKN